MSGENDLRLWGKSRGLRSPYPLVCHLLDAGAAVAILWESYLPAVLQRFLASGLGVGGQECKQLLVFWAALHDIGKVMPSFQMQDEKAFDALSGYPAVGGERRSHGYAAHLWLARALVELGYSERSARCVAQMLGGHHGCFFPMDTQAMREPLKAAPELGVGKWDEQRRLLVKRVRQVVGEPPSLKKVDPAAAGLACGLVVLADWLVSQDDFLIERLKEIPKTGDLESLVAHFQASLRAAPKLLEEAGLGRLRLKPGKFSEEFPFKPNDLQRSIEEQLPGLLTGGAGLLLIMAPMGEGKTEAALHGARLMGEVAGAPGMFIGLPTMATADQMYGRVEEYGRERAAGTASLTLLHGMAWLNSAYQPDESEPEVLTGEGETEAQLEATAWLRGPKRGLLAPWAVGTIDQALIAALKGRHNMLRLLGLAGKVLVVDEVHAYDEYMQHLLRTLLSWLGKLGVPVVLLSATLPVHVARRLVESYLNGAGHKKKCQEDITYPGWLYADGTTGHVTPKQVVSEPKSLQAELHEVSLDAKQRPARIQALQELLAPLAETDTGCVGIICNTVAEAQQTYTELRRWLDSQGRRDTLVELLHSRFPAEDREEITKKIVSRYGKRGAETGQHPRKGSVLVATQVIEQSIDLDFDLMISDLAPVALLLQRAGRCWRHDHNPRPSWATGPRLAILTPNADPASWPFVYPTAFLRRTRELLTDREDRPILIPDDVQGIVDKVYDEDFADGGMQMDDIERIADKQVKEGFAQMLTVPGPRGFSSLHELTDRELDDKLFSTRLGADSARIVCCYKDEHGARWLDEKFSVALPEQGTGSKGKFTRAELKAILGRSIPVPGSWITGLSGKNAPPAAWSKNSHLRDLLLVDFERDVTGRVRPAALGSRSVILTRDMGLLVHDGDS